jgi:hypothetical protein
MPAANTTWGVMMSRKNAFTWNSEHQSEQQALNNVVLPGAHRIQTLAASIEMHNQ